MHEAHTPREDGMRRGNKTQGRTEHAVFPPSSQKNMNNGTVHRVWEVVKVLCIALLLRYFVVSAHVIPSGSMEDTLLTGDFLLSLPWVHGLTLPYTDIRIPGTAAVEQGDVIIFRAACNPKEDFIKRCVAVAGQTVTVTDKKLRVDGKPFTGRFKVKHSDPRVFPAAAVVRDNFGPLTLPRAGDSLEVPVTDIPGGMPFDMVALLVLQENTHMVNNDPFFFVNRLRGVAFDPSAVTVRKRLFLDSTLVSDLNGPVRYGDLAAFDRQVRTVRYRYPASDVRVEQQLYLHGQRLYGYRVRYDTYFAMGDNRDNSLDSRYWGVVSEKVITAAPLIIFWSWETDGSALRGEQSFNPLVRLKDVAFTVLTNIHNGGLITRPRWRRMFRLI